MEEAAERVRSQECVVDALGHMGIVIPAAIGEPDMECRRVGGIVDLEDCVNDPFRINTVLCKSAEGARTYKEQMAMDLWSIFSPDGIMKS